MNLSGVVHQGHFAWFQAAQGLQLLANPPLTSLTTF
jgi:hypothetical protein